MYVHDCVHRQFHVTLWILSAVLVLATVKITACVSTLTSRVFRRLQVFVDMDGVTWRYHVRLWWRKRGNGRNWCSSWHGRRCVYSGAFCLNVALLVISCTFVSLCRVATYCKGSLTGRAAPIRFCAARSSGFKPDGSPVSVPRKTRLMYQCCVLVKCCEWTKFVKQNFICNNCVAEIVIGGLATRGVRIRWLPLVIVKGVLSLSCLTPYVW